MQRQPGRLRQVAVLCLAFYSLVQCSRVVALSRSNCGSFCWSLTVLFLYWHIDNFPLRPWLTHSHQTTHHTRELQVDEIRVLEGALQGQARTAAVVRALQRI